MSEDVRGISTYKTYLMYRTSSANSYDKLVDIVDFPDMIGTPERIDITTLSDGQRVYIPGISDREDMTFNANYTPANFKAVHNLEGHQYEYSLWFGGTGEIGSVTPDGSLGKFDWTGDVRAGLTGGANNEPVRMTITFTPSTEVVPNFPN